MLRAQSRAGRRRVASRTAAVEGLEGRRLLTSYIVTSAADNENIDGQITLREAIDAANRNTPAGDAPAGQVGSVNGVFDTISFNIPGSGVHTVTLGTSLDVTDTLLISGYTQPGAKVNTLAAGDNATLLIDIKTQSATTAFVLDADAPGSGITGLAIEGNAGGTGISLQGSSDHIFGDFIGTNLAGTAFGGADIGIDVNGSRNVIGMPTPANRNVILGNTAISVQGSNNFIVNDLIGTDAAGDKSLTPSIPFGAPGGVGIDIRNSDRNTIGGTDAGTGNVISGWTNVGVLVEGATHTQVEGNLIGTDATGKNIIGNTAGIAIDHAAADNGIGDKAGNVFAGISVAAVSISSTSATTDFPLRNAVVGNTFFSNRGLNIDLAISPNIGGDGPTANDFKDADSGPNDLQNAPNVGEALANAANHATTVNGAINSVPDNAFLIDFYDTVNGRTSPIGATIVSTDDTGNASYSATLPNFAAGSGDVLSATASLFVNGAASDTSEFSAGVVGNPSAPALSIADTSITEGDTGTKNMTFTVSLKGKNPNGVSVQLATINNRGATATIGEDYVAKSGFLIWAAGDTSPKTFTVAINGDTKIESDERLAVQLSNPSGVTLDNDTALGTIVDDDTPKISVDNAAVTEGNSGTKTLTFTFHRTGNASGAASVKFATADGKSNPATAGSDYVSKSGTVSWAAKDKADKKVSVTINGDTKNEANETFVVNLSAATGASLANSQGTGTITNDDPLVLQAETATLAGGTKKVNWDSGFTGSGYADFGGSGSSVNFTNAFRFTAGAATLTFNYANGSTVNRPLTVTVNGKSVGTVTFPPTGSFTTWKTVSFVTSLLSGENTIQLTAGSAGGPNLDAMSVF